MRLAASTAGVVLAALVAGVAFAATSESRAGRGARIAYWQDLPWPTIWTMRPDGSQRRRILRNHQNAKRPAISPDRRWIAFDGTPPGQRPMSDFDVQIVRPDGTGRRTLTASSAWDLDAQWSPDGRLLSFSRQPPSPQDARRSTVCIVGRDGHGLRSLVGGFGARWSPDGTSLVYETRAGDLHVIGADGSGDRALGTPTSALEWPAGWSPNGRRILFTRSPRENVFDVFVINADGAGVEHLARGVAGSWSPDGSKIVYTAGFPGSVYVMNADGSHKRRLTPFAAADPSWR